MNPFLFVPIIFILFTAINYLFYWLTIAIGEWIKKLLKHQVKSWNEKSVLYVMLPYLLASFLLFGTIVLLSIEYINTNGGSSDLVGGILFWQVYKYYLASIFGNVFGRVGLVMTRYSYSKQFEVTGKLKKRREVMNFLMLSLISLILVFVNKLYLDKAYFSLWINILIMIGIVYLYMKKLNRENE